MSEQNQQDNKTSEDKRKTVYLNRLTLYGQPGEKGQAPRMVWSVFDGNPRLEVRTGVPDDEKVNYGKITAPIDVITLGVLANMIRQASTSEPGWRQKIANKNTWHNGQKHEQPIHINDIIVGKDSEGSVYISLHEENRPNIRFFFGSGQWHHVVKSDGSPLSRPEFSAMYAKAYADMLEMIIASVVGYGTYDATYTDHDGNQTRKSFGNQNQNNGQGGYQKGNWNNNRQGGYQKGNWQNKGQGNWQGKSGGNWNRGQGGNNWQGNRQGGQNNNYNRASEADIADEDIQF